MDNLEIPDFDVLSLASRPLTLRLEETNTVLGEATGFIFNHNGQAYLITNWHVVTGLSPSTKKPIGNHAGMPDLISFPVVKRRSEIEIDYFICDSKLYKQNGQPYWYVHPTLQEKIDVIALPIGFSDPNVEINAINDDQRMNLDRFKYSVADEVLILGFPFGIKQLYFPLWKRGSIATEPEFDYESLPLILVDTATRPGMSGAPVLVRRLCRKEGNYFFAKQFIGVYSGRNVTGKTIEEKELFSQLGRVWKKKVITEIIEGKMNDKSRR